MVINASAAITLLEQRPEKNSGSERGYEPTTSAMPVQCSPSEPEFFSGLCSSSVTATLALMTVSTFFII